MIKLAARSALVVGSTGICFYIFGAIFQTEHLCLIAACLGRISALLYSIWRLGKVKETAILAVIFAIIGAFSGDRIWLYLELCFMALTYQAIAWSDYAKDFGTAQETT